MARQVAFLREGLETELAEEANPFVYILFVPFDVVDVRESHPADVTQVSSFGRPQRRRVEHHL